MITTPYSLYYDAKNEQVVFEQEYETLPTVDIGTFIESIDHFRAAWGLPKIVIPPDSEFLRVADTCESIFARKPFEASGVKVTRILKRFPKGEIDRNIYHERK